MGAAAPNLRKLAPEQRVTAITHCRDTYRVTTSDGQIMDYWSATFASRPTPARSVR
jgi:cytochrome c